MMFLCSHPEPCPEVIVYVTDDLDPDGIGILVEAASGLATNRWADGVVGITSHASDEAGEQVDAVCPLTREWLGWSE